MDKQQFVFRFRDRSVLLGEKTYVMGIINVTPDSFSDGGDHFSPENALAAATQMEQEGADFLDVGGQSTRPGHIPISPEEEWSRLEPALKLILSHTALPVSVDTFYPAVAERALAAGCHIINDVSGRVNPEMAAVVREYGAGWILMHASEEQTDDICRAVHDRLAAFLDAAGRFGIDREHICLDPGIGFGKSMEENARLIAETARVRVPGVAYLLGASRKRVIGTALDRQTPFKQRDPGTVAAHTVGIMGGADIIRVHDCVSGCQGARVADFILGKNGLKGAEV